MPGPQSFQQEHPCLGIRLQEADGTAAVEVAQGGNLVGELAVWHAEFQDHVLPEAASEGNEAIGQSVRAPDIVELPALLRPGDEVWQRLKKRLTALAKNPAYGSSAEGSSARMGPGVEIAGVFPIRNIAGVPQRGPDSFLGRCEPPHARVPLLRG